MRCPITLLGALALVFSSHSAASDLSAQGTRSERAAWQASSGWWDATMTKIANWGVLSFKEPVHEEITQRAYDCDSLNKGICDQPDADFAPWQVIAGVRWNDDPPFQLSGDIPGHCRAVNKQGQRMSIRFISQPECWGKLYLGALDQLKNNPSTKFNTANQSALPLRSHLGDLQFLHSMAAEDQESAKDTLGKILGWGEFTWGIVSGEHVAATWLRDIKQPALIANYFGESGWRVQDLFALGDPNLRRNLGDVAFGSLLHMVQDSFSASHVERMSPTEGALCPGSTDRVAGPIRQFHSYTHQDKGRHANADTQAAFINDNNNPNAVKVSKVLVRMRAERKPWSDIERYLRCVYDLAPDVQSAQAGVGFSK